MHEVEMQNEFREHAIPIRALEMNIFIFWPPAVPQETGEDEETKQGLTYSVALSKAASFLKPQAVR